MRPPICGICDQDLMDNGGLIYFAKSENDLAWDKKMEEPGMVGHPPYAEWFCEKHYIIAKKYQQLTKEQAIKKIYEEL